MGPTDHVGTEKTIIRLRFWSYFVPFIRFPLQNVPMITKYHWWKVNIYPWFLKFRGSCYKQMASSFYCFFSPSSRGQKEHCWNTFEHFYLKLCRKSFFGREADLPIVKIIIAALRRDEGERKLLLVVEMLPRPFFLNLELCLYEMSVMMFYGRTLKCTFD